MDPNTPPPVIIDTKPTNKKKVILILIAALVGIIAVIAIIIAVAFSGDANDKKSAVKQPTPKPVITLGGNRYVQPCQALPPKTVAKIFANYSDTGYYHQTYYDQSISTEAISSDRILREEGIKSSCNYGFRDAERTVFDVTLKQYLNPELALADWQKNEYYGSDASLQDLQKYQAELERGPLPKEQDPLGFSKSSQALLKTIIEGIEERRAQSGGTTIGDLDKSILFVPARGEFTGYYKHFVINLKYNAGGTSYFDASRTINAEQAQKLLGPIKLAFDEIYNNIDNQKLSTEPYTSTVDVDKKIGATQILEPCDVLTNSVLKLATSSIPVAEVETSSTARKLEAVKGTNQMGLKIYPSNSCQRTTLSLIEDTADQNRSYDASIDIRYFPNAKEAKAFIRPHIKAWQFQKEGAIDESQVRELKNTKADHVILFDDTTTNPNKSLIAKEAYLSYGPYEIRLSIDAFDEQSRDYVTVSDEVYVKAINQVVDNIKAQL